MTDDELRRLAEIAGLETYYHNGKLHAFYDKRNFYEDWDPPNKINQAMMVADEAFGFWQLTRSKTIDNEWRFRVTASYKSREHGCLSVDSGWLSTAEYAFCAAALAAKEG